MQRLEVSGAVRFIYRSLGVKGLNRLPNSSLVYSSNVSVAMGIIRLTKIF